VSLGPMAEYIARIEDTYGEAKPGTLHCRECAASIDFWPPGKKEKREGSCLACGWTTILGVSL
jgi:hypothetical protein